MMLLGQLSPGDRDPELLVGILAIAFLVCCGVWALMKFVLQGPVQPDPWDESITTEIGGEEATPLCHRCLTAHEPSTDFCPTCGAAVGQYTNWLPYPYLFSVGHMLRIGTSGEFRRSPLSVLGFLLFSFAEYTLLAPVYWFFLLRSPRKTHEQDSSHEQSPPR